MKLNVFAVILQQEFLKTSKNFENSYNNVNKQDSNPVCLYIKPMKKSGTSPSFTNLYDLG